MIIMDQYIYIQKIDMLFHNYFLMMKSNYNLRVVVTFRANRNVFDYEQLLLDTMW